MIAGEFSLISAAPNFGPEISQIVIPWVTMCDVVEKDINCLACNAKAELVTKIKDVFKYLPKDTVRNACAGFVKSC